MTEGFFRKTAGAGAQVAQIGLEAARVKEKVEHAMEDGVTAARQAVEDGVTAARQAVEDGVIAAKRAAKRGRYAAEDLLDETTHCVKQNPLGAVAVSFWAGVGLGALIIWVASHNHRD